MVTNEERREVAARLRSIKMLWWRIDTPGYRCRADAWDEMEKAIKFHDADTYNAVFNRLADLIEPTERTCRLVETDHEYEASYRCDACKRTVWIDFMGNPRPDYCPNCGAKVMENER